MKNGKRITDNARILKFSIFHFPFSIFFLQDFKLIHVPKFV